MLSPDFGGTAEVKKLTRDPFSRVETDLGPQVEWVAVAQAVTDLVRLPSIRRRLLDFRIDNQTKLGQNWFPDE